MTDVSVQRVVWSGPYILGDCSSCFLSFSFWRQKREEIAGSVLGIPWIWGALIGFLYACVSHVPRAQKLESRCTAVDVWFLLAAAFHIADRDWGTVFV